MPNLIAAVADKINGVIDRNYQVDKSKMQQAVDGCEVAAIAGLISSIALTLLGITSCVAGGWVFLGGAVMIFVSLPIGFFSYNSLMILNNFHAVLDNPKQYKNKFGFGSQVDSKKLETRLIEKTIFFDWFVRFAVKNMFIEMLQRKTS